MIVKGQCDSGNRKMAKGTVKSFNRSKGYGFIRTDSGEREIFVHRSVVQNAGLVDLRKGQKVSFEIFDNQGKAAAKNLSLDRTKKYASKHKSAAIKNGMVKNAWLQMTATHADQLKEKRKPITRAALELAIADAVRASDPQCEALIGIIVERVVLAAPGGANWVVKGIKYGKADRDRCGAALSQCVEERQREFEISD
jgi:CspA family cold shock protein